MLRRSVEVVAITGSVALLAGILGLLELGAIRALPAVAGAASATGLVFFRRSESVRRALIAAFSSGIAAFAIDCWVVYVLAAGYPELREVAGGPLHHALIVAIFGALAGFDATASGEPDARP
jgi:hypothetical protein